MFSFKKNLFDRKRSRSPFNNDIPADLSVILVRNTARQMDNFNDGHMESAIEKINNRMNDLSEGTAGLSKKGRYDIMTKSLRQIE